MGPVLMVDQIPAKVDVVEALSLAVLQSFMSHLMRKLRELGIRTPEPQNLPPIIYHDGRANFPGETMEAAARAGGNHFKAKPAIIFVLLPDACESPL